MKNDFEKFKSTIINEIPGYTLNEILEHDLIYKKYLKLLDLHKHIAKKKSVSNKDDVNNLEEKRDIKKESEVIISSEEKKQKIKEWKNLKKKEDEEKKKLMEENKLKENEKQHNKTELYRNQQKKKLKEYQAHKEQLELTELLNSNVNNNINDNKKEIENKLKEQHQRDIIKRKKILNKRKDKEHEREKRLKEIASKITAVSVSRDPLRLFTETESVKQRNEQKEEKSIFGVQDHHKRYQLNKLFVTMM